MTLSEALLCLMDLAGLQASDIVRETGLDKGYLSKVLSGKVSEPGWHRMISICEALRVTPDEFLALQRSGVVPESYRLWVRREDPARFDDVMRKRGLS